MNDLISRQATMVVIECSGLDDDSKDTVVRVLEQLPSAQSDPGWIPVSERLPEADGRYLVTCSAWAEWTVDWNIWHNVPKPSWLWEQGVTAWMPLPEPYKEGT